MKALQILRLILTLGGILETVIIKVAEAIKKPKQ